MLKKYVVMYFSNNKLKNFTVLKKLFLFLIITNQTTLTAQTVVSNPSSSYIDNSYGTVGWNNGFLSYNSDNLRTTTNIMLTNNITNYIVLTNFGFNIPINAIITGITVSIEKRNPYLLISIVDNSVMLVKNGIITAYNLASPTPWNLTDANTQYGNSSELWGNSWTYSDINSSNFGVAISCKLTFGVLATAEIDNVKISITYYMGSLPVELVYFESENKINKVLLKWLTQTEINNDFFTVERSHDGLTFNELTVIKGNGFSNEKKLYITYDNNPIEGISYYRLKQTDYNGNYVYNNLITNFFRGDNHKKLIRTINIFGEVINKDSNDAIIINIFDDNSYEKKIIIK